MNSSEDVFNPSDLSESEIIDHYAKQAHQLVDFVIERAINRLEQDGQITRGPPTKDRDGVQFDFSRDATIILPDTREDYEIKNIDWPNIGEFNSDLGTEKLHEFIKTWHYEDSWLYCIDYIGLEEHKFDTRHRYAVRWSIPTRRKPIPRGTASVYFTFDVSKIKPKDYPVQIYYVFETNRLVHRPGESRFRQQWLKDIIESKVILMESLEI